MAAIDLIGRKLTKIRAMTPEEMQKEGWRPTRNGAPTALEFDDGTVLYPSADPEGNRPGAMFGVLRDGTQFLLPPNEN